MHHPTYRGRERGVGMRGDAMRCDAVLLRYSSLLASSTYLYSHSLVRYTTYFGVFESFRKTALHWDRVQVGTRSFIILPVVASLFYVLSRYLNYYYVSMFKDRCHVWSRLARKRTANAKCRRWRTFAALTRGQHFLAVREETATPTATEWSHARWRRRKGVPRATIKKRSQPATFNPLYWYLYYSTYVTLQYP